MTEPSAVPKANPVVEAVKKDAVTSSRGRLGWLSLTVAAIFAVLYAYNLWDAIRSLVELPGFYDATGLGAANVPWWVLWIGVLIPVLVFAAAFVVGMRRNSLAKALIFFAGWAVVQCLTLGTIALEGILRPSGGS